MKDAGERLAGEDAHQQPGAGAGVAEVEHVAGLGEPVAPAPLDPPAALRPRARLDAHRPAARRRCASTSSPSSRPADAAGAGRRAPPSIRRAMRDRLVARHGGRAGERPVRRARNIMRTSLWTLDRARPHRAANGRRLRAPSELLLTGPVAAGNCPPHRNPRCRPGDRSWPSPNGARSGSATAVVRVFTTCSVHRRLPVLRGDVDVEIRAGRSRRSRSAVRAAAPIADAVVEDPELTTAERPRYRGCRGRRSSSTTKPAEAEEAAEEDESLIEDASELGEDEDDVSDVIDGDIDEEQR